MSARPDIINGHSSAHRAMPAARASQRPQVVSTSSITHFQHVISLGPRCTNTSSVYKAQRKYAGPFDWIFSSPRIVLDCLRDGFSAYLDRQSLFEVATVFDSIGLPPGSAPRDRKLVGHSRYSEMTEGVGRGVIFNHHNPLTEEGHQYISRCAQRFLSALRLNEPKLYSFINIDRKLWNAEAICDLFEELVQRDQGSFLMLAVNCIKNCGDAAKLVEPKLLQQSETGSGTLMIFELQCVGENRGSYFQDPFDAQRVQALMVQPYTFSLSEDPLSTSPVVPAAASADVHDAQHSTNSGPVRRWTSSKGTGQVEEKAEPRSEASRMSRWARARSSGLQNCSNAQLEESSNGSPNP